ncbi:MAG: hypothetical protein R3F59_30310 [Myxococcota bacterium]
MGDADAARQAGRERLDGDGELAAEAAVGAEGGGDAGVLQVGGAGGGLAERREHGALAVAAGAGDGGGGAAGEVAVDGALDVGAGQRDLAQVAGVEQGAAVDEAVELAAGAGAGHGDAVLRGEARAVDDQVRQDVAVGDEAGEQRGPVRRAAGAARHHDLGAGVVRHRRHEQPVHDGAAAVVLLEEGADGGPPGRVDERQAADGPRRRAALHVDGGVVEGVGEDAGGVPPAVGEHEQELALDAAAGAGDGEAHGRGGGERAGGGDQLTAVHRRS